jgi:peptidoglycan/LPS O-acetylase OafA/YrhL
MPLWSLAVEEQFYLLWPCIVLLTPSKHIVKIIVTFLVIGVGSRVICEFGGSSLKGGGFYIFLTPTCFDAFALGAMLAMFYKDGRVSGKFVKIFSRLSIISLFLFAYLMIFFRFPTPQQNILYRLLISIMSVAVIAYLINNKGSLVERAFNNAVLMHIGKISYGVYLFHNFVPFFYQTCSKYLVQKGLLIPFTRYSLLPYPGGFIQYILYFLVLISISSLSWFLFEKPINNLKSRFNYK